ncbi:MAG: hypothetical protein ACK5BJ_04855 [Bacteroidota bacterium]|jgi:hypothetical protein
MKKSVYSISLILLALLLFSCSITKKRYNSGYHFEWSLFKKGNNQTNEVSHTSANKKDIQNKPNKIQIDSSYNQSDNKIETCSRVKTSKNQFSLVADTNKKPSALAIKQSINNLSYSDFKKLTAPLISPKSVVKKNSKSGQGQGDFSILIYLASILLFILCGTLAVLSADMELIWLWLSALLSLVLGLILLMTTGDDFSSSSFFTLLIRYLAILVGVLSFTILLFSSFVTIFGLGF